MISELNYYNITMLSDEIGMFFFSFLFKSFSFILYFLPRLHQSLACRWWDGKISIYDELHEIRSMGFIFTWIL